MIKLNLFANYSAKKSTLVTLDDIVEMITSDSGVEESTESYRSTGDKKHKEGMPCFAPACEFANDGKRLVHVLRPTGLSLCDFDHLPSEQIETLRQKATEDPHTLLVYKTVSGNGLRILYKYETDEKKVFDSQRKDYTRAFTYGNDYYSALFDGAEIDGQCKNITRLSGLAHDADVYYNVDAIPFTLAEINSVKRKETAEKKEARLKAKSIGKIDKVYEMAILPELTKNGAAFEPGRHNDFVMRMGYMFNQYGSNLESVVEWAVSRFGEFYPETEAVIRSCYTRTDEHGTRQFDDKGGKWMTPSEIRDFLTGRYEFKRNVVIQRVEWRKTAPEGEEPNKWQLINDRVINSIWMEMSEEKNVSPIDIDRVINSDYTPEYCPFKEYLDSLPEWEKGDKDYIAELARTITIKGGKEKQKLFEKYLKKWIVWMVAGWISDKVVNNVVLVIIGKQGIYKTTWMEALLPEELKGYFYMRRNTNRMTKDDAIAVSDNGLICNDEIEYMTQSELNQFKAIVTQSVIAERAAYARYAENRPHRASFCGTGNNVEFLNDKSGNRRWLPFVAESIKSPRKYPFNHEGIYAQAYSLLKSGFRYWFTQKEMDALNLHNEDFEAPKLEHELIQTYLRKPYEDEIGEFLTVSDILQTIGVGFLGHKLSKIAVGRAMKDLGFTFKRNGKITGYIAMRYTSDEIISNRKRIAMK